MFVPYFFCAIVTDISLFKGRVPKNDFGNIDLYVPSMLPQGAVHLPSKYTYISTLSMRLSALNTVVPGVGKIAKEFEMDFAEAVVRNTTSLKHPSLTMMPGWIRI